MEVDLGPINTLGAELVRRNNERTFCIYVQNEQNSVVFWLDNGKLKTLSQVLDRFLAKLTEVQVLRTEVTANKQQKSSHFPKSPTYNLQVSQIVLNYDEPTAIFQVQVIPLKQNTESIRFTFTQLQASDLSNAIASVISTVKLETICPLCHAPLSDGPHSCVRQNGHRIIETVEEEDE